MNELIATSYERSSGRFHITYYDVKEGWISLKNRKTCLSKMTSWWNKIGIYNRNNLPVIVTFTITKKYIISQNRWVLFFKPFSYLSCANLYFPTVVSSQSLLYHMVYRMYFWYLFVHWDTNLNSSRICMILVPVVYRVGMRYLQTTMLFFSVLWTEKIMAKIQDVKSHQLYSW
jgi:hypothetical protein